MKKRLILQVFLALGLLLQATLVSAAKTIEQDPYALLRTYEGVSHTLEDFTNKGKWLVVIFWAYDCGNCNIEAKGYQALHDQRKDTDLELLGISIDGWENREESKKFIDRHGLAFPNLIGENEYISELFASLSGRFLAGTPAMFIYDPSGMLKAAEIGAVPISVIEQFIADKMLEENSST